MNSEGFEEVVDSCCFDDMKDFVRRLVGEEGYKICDEGGLNGFVPFFSCSNKTSLLEMKMQMKSGTEGACPWLAFMDGECRAPADECRVVTNPEHRPSLLRGYIGIEAENNP